MNSLIIVLRLLLQARPLLGWMGLAILLGVLTIGSGLGLMMLSAYLISEAALHPDLLQAEGLYWKLWQVQNSVLAAQP